MRFFLPLLGAALAWGQQSPAPAAKAPSPQTLPPQLAAPMPAPSMVAPDAVVLTVGGEKLTKTQFDLILASLPPQQQQSAQTPAGRKAIAEKLAEIITLAEAAKAQQLDQTPRVKAQLLLTADQVLASTMYRVFVDDAKPDEAALKAYYEAHKAEWEETKASHILIRFKGSQVPLADGKKDLTEAEALAKATELRARIVAGADFATVAKESSDDTGSGVNGGELGSFGKGQMTPEFEKVAFSTPVGQISEPVKTPFGYHIIKVEARGAKPYEDVKAVIEKRVPGDMAQKQLTELKAKTPTVYSDAYFK